jgi:hypothetical protein
LCHVKLGSCGPVRPATTPLPRSSTSAMSARLTCTGRSNPSTLSTAPTKQVAVSSLPIRYSAGYRLSPTISTNNKEQLNEDAHESTCNRSAGGRRHDRKCPTVRKPHSAVRSNGRRQFAQQYSCFPPTTFVNGCSCTTAGDVGQGVAQRARAGQKRAAQHARQLVTACLRHSRIGFECARGRGERGT